ncbi:hypothetical protein OG511_05630 [Streptomyces sp. NBC_01453]|nr:hypothetical protein [Streptomyces sp. NBC_01453]
MRLLVEQAQQCRELRDAVLPLGAHVHRVARAGETREAQGPDPLGQVAGQLEDVGTGDAEPVGEERPAAARHGHHDRAPGAARAYLLALRAGQYRFREVLVVLRDQDPGLPAQGGEEQRVARDGGGVRERRPLAGLAHACLQYDDLLARLPCGAAEFGQGRRIAYRFQIQAQDPDVGTAQEVAAQTGDVVAGLVARADVVAVRDPALLEELGQHDAHAAAVRDDRHRARCGGRAVEVVRGRGVQGARAAHQAHAVGPDQGHVTGRGPELLLELDPFGAGLREPRRQDDHRAGAGGPRPGDTVHGGLRRYRYHQQVEWGVEFTDVGDGRNLHLRAGSDGDDLAVEAARPQALDRQPSPGGGAARHPQDPDAAREEQPVESGLRLLLHPQLQSVVVAGQTGERRSRKAAVPSFASAEAK